MALTHQFSLQNNFHPPEILLYRSADDQVIELRPFGEFGSRLLKAPGETFSRFRSAEAEAALQFGEGRRSEEDGHEAGAQNRVLKRGRAN